MKNKRIVYILSAVVILLMIPLIAMQFTKEVDWSAFDFLLMGIMLTGTGLLCELVLREPLNTALKGRDLFSGNPTFFI